MTDDGNTGSNTGTGDGDNAAETFWKEHEKRTRSVLDAWLKEHTDKAGPGTSRTGKPATGLPKILADVLGGPFATSKD